jgi:hypothetical protein
MDYTPNESKLFTREEVENLIVGLKRDITQAVEMEVTPIVGELLTRQKQQQKQLNALWDELKLCRQDAEVKRVMPINPRNQLPDLNAITKIRVQFFDNKANAPPTYSKKRSTIPNHLLKLYVWTCNKRDVSQYAEGTCGNLWQPVDTSLRAEQGIHSQAHRHDAGLPARG